ncbi:MAG TPA: tetratricopeptide repeat protein, partial [candidate division Zixibacteria bacterium]|nr:tetratricopeptide repeat protein [candidate division Zixibacteria bacterium]
AEAFAWKGYAHVWKFFNFDLGWSAEPEKGLQSIQRALELSPNLPDAHLAQGTYHNFVERDYESALREFNTALPTIRDRGLLLREIGIVYMRQGKWDEAIEKFREAAGWDPRSQDLAFTEAIANWFKHDFEAALRSIDRAISMAPLWPEGYSTKMYIQLTRDGNTAAALETLRSAPASLSRAQLYSWDIGSATDIALWRFFLTGAPTDIWIDSVVASRHVYEIADYYLTLGELYRVLGRDDSAFVYFDSSRAFVQQRIDEAAEQAKKYGKNNPEDFGAFQILAMLNAYTGNHKDALRAAARAIQLMPVEACHW